MSFYMMKDTTVLVSLTTALALSWDCLELWQRRFRVLDFSSFTFIFSGAHPDTTLHLHCTSAYLQHTYGPPWLYRYLCQNCHFLNNHNFSIFSAYGCWIQFVTRHYLLPRRVSVCFFLSPDS